MSKQGKPELENMKFEVAREYGINLKRGYNGDLSSTDTGHQRQHSQSPMQ